MKTVVLDTNDRCVCAACVLPVHSGACIYKTFQKGFTIDGFHTTWRKGLKSKLSEYQKRLLMRLSDEGRLRLNPGRKFKIAA